MNYSSQKRLTPSTETSWPPPAGNPPPGAPLGCPLAGVLCAPAPTVAQPLGCTTRQKKYKSHPETWGSVPALPPWSRSDARSPGCWSRSRLGAGIGAGAASGGRRSCPRALLPRGAQFRLLGAGPDISVFFYDRDLSSRLATVDCRKKPACRMNSMWPFAIAINLLCE